jgi:hypothetical protein
MSTNTDGWVKVYRQILENPIVCKDSAHFAVWVYLLLKATHKEIEVVFKGQKILLKCGQLITGRKIISQQFDIPEWTVQRILKTLENEQQIAQQTSTQNRLISVLNWELYQVDEQQIEQQVHNECTTNAQRMHTNKNVRSKECKNDKKIKDIEDIYITVQGMPLSKEDYQKLVDKYAQEKVDDKIEYAKNYKLLTKKYTDLYLTMNNWLKGDIKKANETKKEGTGNYFFDKIKEGAYDEKKGNSGDTGDS